MGDPATRDAAQVARDVRDGLVSPDKARTLYKAAVGPDGTLDVLATTALRGA